MDASIIYLDTAEARAKYGVSPSVRAITVGLAGYHFLTAAGFFVLYSGNGRTFWGRR